MTSACISALNSACLLEYSSADVNIPLRKAPYILRHLLLQGFHLPPRPPILCQHLLLPRTIFQYQKPCCAVLHVLHLCPEIFNGQGELGLPPLPCLFFLRLFQSLCGFHLDALLIEWLELPEVSVPHQWIVIIPQGGEVGWCTIIFVELLKRVYVTGRVYLWSCLHTSSLLYDATAVALFSPWTRNCVSSLDKYRSTHSS